MYRTGDAIQMVQALLGDPKGQWVKRGYILPLLNITYGAVVLNLKNASSKNLQAVIPILDVPAGTTSLYPWQNGSAPVGQNPGIPNGNVPVLLAGLTDVIEIFVKPAGSAIQHYRKIQTRGTLPHVNPQLVSSNSWGQPMYYSLIGNKLQITPAAQPMDIEVTGKFNQQPLVQDDDLLTAHEDVWIPTCFETAAVAGVERSNPAILEGYALKGAAAEDNIIAELIRQKQGEPVRFQKMSRESGSGQWFWG
jgi:hypothetical protein